MNSIVNLDILVVYSAGVALSASVKDSFSKQPFLSSSREAGYNLSYAYFLDMCKKNGMKAGFTTSADIIGAGKCKSYWKLLADNWVKVIQPAQSQQIFDKLSPVSLIRSAERQLLLSDESITSFNDPKLFNVFFDKLLTFQSLPEYAIPTVEIVSHKNEDINQGIFQLRQLMKQHRYQADFSSKLVLKDRFGAGGNHVYKISKNCVKQISTIMFENPKISFILQPFLAFDKGFAYKQNRTSTDIRLIFHRNKLLQSYLRMAKNDDFRCNEHQGGQLVYVAKSEIPDLVHQISKKIVSKINKVKSLYALDFVISNSGHIYFVEGNIGPGIDWDASKAVNVKMSKQLIRSIVNELTLRVTDHKILARNTEIINSKQKANIFSVFNQISLNLPLLSPVAQLESQIIPQPTV